MIFSFSASNGSGPGIWWRSSLLLSYIIVGFLLYLESWHGNRTISMLMPTSGSSASTKLNDQIKALQEKVDILQKRYVWLLIRIDLVILYFNPKQINASLAFSHRFWLEPLEPIWQYRGKYYLGKTGDVEDKDQVKHVTNLCHFSTPAFETPIRMQISLVSEPQPPLSHF
jgi:hypothetical protein